MKTRGSPRSTGQSSRVAKWETTPRNSVKETYEAAREYAEGIDVVDFVRREPWLALALASAIGSVSPE
jgi:ElaB/YqjD/DUF883 family membrane-anchored ribosome-binding protein